MKKTSITSKHRLYYIAYFSFKNLYYAQMNFIFLKENVNEAVTILLTD